MRTLHGLFGDDPSIDDTLLHAGTKVEFDDEEKTLHVIILLDTFIDESKLKPITKRFKSEFPSLDTIYVDCQYEISEFDPEDAESVEEIISLYFSNIIYFLEQEKPFIASIIKNAKREYKDAWIFTVDQPSFFLLESMNIARKLQDFLHQRLGTIIPILFEIDEREKEKEETKKPTPVPSMQLDAPIPPVEKIADTGNGFNFNGGGYQGGGGRRRGGRNRFRDSIKSSIDSLNQDFIPDEKITVRGEIFDLDERILRNNNMLLTFDLTDFTNSITCKMFASMDEYETTLSEHVQKGKCLKVEGQYRYDDFSKDHILMIDALTTATMEKPVREDTSEEKRVELHLHSNMSGKDGISAIGDYVKEAASWGHKAIGITDHGVVQGFPEAMYASWDHDMKILYGVESYIVDDLSPIAQKPQDRKLTDENETFIVFDLETTGLTKDCKIIEIGAVKIKDGQIREEFGVLVDPEEPLPAKIIELTGITDQMLEGEAKIEEVFPKFLDFVDNGVLVAHNADFDMGFIGREAKRQNIEFTNPSTCTLELSRILFPELKTHRLNIVAKHLGISLENHHRAVDDARATAEIFLVCLDKLIIEEDIEYIRDINTLATSGRDIKSMPSWHCIIYAKNKKGLENLYELISNSHIEHFYRTPRMPKSEILEFKENLIIGSACSSGEIYDAVLKDRPKEQIEALIHYYDYLEIQPTANNGYLVRNEIVKDEKELEAINHKIVALGEEYDKPVVATTDCHFLHPDQELYRAIIMAGHGFKDVDESNPLYLRTTDEMLEEFSYLGEEKAREVVITNTNMIADMIDELEPIPQGVYPPKLKNADENLRKDAWQNAKNIYGDPLPEIVEKRIQKELDSIIGNGFASLYTVSQKLVDQSVEDGYLVGSRGSVGSSLVATVTGITEVNPLSPHYICDKCQYTEFDSERVLEFGGMSGCDMPDAHCPECGEPLIKEGHDIAFETFLGFDGDKEPDIDLNFSGEYQAKAHEYAEELFGSDYIFKAGTIGTLADKTAYGFTMKYLEERGLHRRKAEINRLAKNCTGVKRSTGQHPGGLVVVPEGHSIYEFTPIQHPADDASKDVITTHFDFHSLEGHLFKLDILGHDVPTIIRDLKDSTGVDPQHVDIGDPKVIEVYSSPKPLGLTEKELGCSTGSLGLPEFGTPFVRQMLEETGPSTFSELVRISGLSHGTMVWTHNGQDLVKDGTATLKEIVSTRDQIMNDLISHGVDNHKAFVIMENVRKGRPVKDDEVEMLREKGVEEWYIESCQKIQYLFPKGHAVAYVMMAVRIAYFKIYHPTSFYTAIFSTKLSDFDYETMCQGLATAQAEKARIESLGWEASNKEKNDLVTLEIVIEMYLRDIMFEPMDIYRSNAVKFKMTDDGILPPLATLPGLGKNAADAIVAARDDGEFLSQEDLRNRTGVSKTVVELLEKYGIIDGMPETNQLTLF